MCCVLGEYRHFANGYDSLLAKDTIQLILLILTCGPPVDIVLGPFRSHFVSSPLVQWRFSVAVVVLLQVDPISILILRCLLADIDNSYCHLGARFT